jgi:hypothetical protein
VVSGTSGRDSNHKIGLDVLQGISTERDQIDEVTYITPYSAYDHRGRNDFVRASRSEVTHEK